jgi:putative ABC transport system permease protein
MGMIPRHWLALLRVAAGHARRRPVQSGLLVLGVALGVAVGVAIDLANASALGAFNLSTEAVTGRATYQVVGGPTGLGDDVYRRLRVDLGLRSSAPVVEATVGVRELGGEQLTLLGVDPLAEAPFRDLVPVAGAAGGGALRALLTTPAGVVLSRDTAARAGVGVGAALTLDVGARVVRARVVGVLDPADALSRRALTDLLVADIGAAQEMLDRVGRLDRIDLRLGGDPRAADAEIARIAAVLPPDATVTAASETRAAVEGMTAAFRLNLTALSLLALLVGMFLIFNTVRFSVLQRRATLATLRVLGVTRREIFGLVLAEAAVLGLVGSLLGLGLGILLGRGAVALVTRTINDLFYVTSVRGVTIPPATLVRGIVLGTGAALVAAFVPALEATSVSPVAAMRRSVLEQGARRMVPRALALGGILAALAAFLIGLPGERVDVGFAALFAVVLAFALAVPAFTLWSMALVTPLTARLAGPVGRMAPRDVTRALSRTAVAIAALMVAVSVSIGVQVMVESFRRTVEDWLARTLQADVFVSPVSVTSTRIEDALDPGLRADLAARPEVARSSTALEVTVRSPESGAVRLVVLGTDLADDDRRYLAATGTPAQTWAAVEGGAVVVSEPFARRHGVTVGDPLKLLTDAGARVFPVAGVFFDYGSNTGVVLMADAVYRAHWADDRVTSLALIVRPGTDVDRLVADLRARAVGRQAVQVRSNRALRADVMAVFDRAFAITAALRVLAIVVAFVGVLSALMALQLERARDHATLRATGVTRGQLGALTVLETALVGATAGVLSWPSGLLLALILIHVINRRSFGWTIVTTVSPGAFLAALALAVVAALLAGVYPAWRLGRLPIARALREE